MAQPTAPRSPKLAPASDDDACLLLGGARKSTHGCRVPGCGAELSELRNYYKRYRCCEAHVKADQVLCVDTNKLCRFCQLCGRFHMLAAFDGDRRSCRARLAKHNARRKRDRKAAGGGVPADSQRPGPNSEGVPAVVCGTTERTSSNDSHTDVDQPAAGPSGRPHAQQAGVGAVQLTAVSERGLTHPDLSKPALTSPRMSSKSDVTRRASSLAQEASLELLPPLATAGSAATTSRFPTYALTATMQQDVAPGISGLPSHALNVVSAPFASLQPSHGGATYTILPLSALSSLSQLPPGYTIVATNGGGNFSAGNLPSFHLPSSFSQQQLPGQAAATSWPLTQALAQLQQQQQLQQLQQQLQQQQPLLLQQSPLLWGSPLLGASQQQQLLQQQLLQQHLATSNSHLALQQPRLSLQGGEAGIVGSAAGGVGVANKVLNLAAPLAGQALPLLVPKQEQSLDTLWHTIQTAAQ